MAHLLAQQALEFLRSHTSGVLATITPDGKPHASVIYYTVDEDGGIAFVTKDQTQKSKNLQHNPWADFVVYDEKKQIVVQLTGRAERQPDEAKTNLAFRHALKASLNTANNAIPPISKLVAGNYVAYRLEPDEARMAIFNRRSSQQSPGVFESFKLPGKPQAVAG